MCEDLEDINGVVYVFQGWIDVERDAERGPDRVMAGCWLSEERCHCVLLRGMHVGVLGNMPRWLEVKER